MYIAFSVITLILYLPLTITCCGVGVHLCLLARTLSYIPETAKDPIDFTQTGAFFPDAFYSCMGLSEAAEAAHWPPFLKSAVEFWREKYDGDGEGAMQIMKNSSNRKSRRRRVWEWLTNRKTTASEANQLKSFIYGVLTHQVADVSWHSLGVKQGLLEMLSEMEFQGDLDKAHSILDTGGDMIMIKRLLNSGINLDWFNRGKYNQWRYPTKDIQEIMSRLGYGDIPNTSLDYCMLRGKAALDTEFLISQTGYVSFANQSPLLLESLENYYLGSAVEMTMAIRHCINGLNRWFEQGPDDDPWELCDIFKMKRPGGENQQYYEYYYSNVPHSITSGITSDFPEETELVAATIDTPIILSTGMKQGCFGQSITFGNFLNDQEPSIAFSAPFESSTGSIYIMPVRELLKEPQQQPTASTIANTQTVENIYQYNERYGHKMVTLKIYDKDILVVSRPGISQLDFYYQGILINHIRWDHVETEYGKRGRKLIGEELLTIKNIQNNQIEDLIIGAPHSDVNGHSQQGEVFIIYGSTLVDILDISQQTSSQKAGIRFYDIADIKVINIPESPDTVYSLFGQKIAVSDDGNNNSRLLLIGAPGLGKVYSISPYDGHELKYTLEADKNVNSKLAFGGSLLVASKDLIIIGNSHENVGGSSDNCIQCGVVYVYKKPLNNTATPQFVKKITGASAFDRFGENGVKIGNNIYITSSYGNNDRGMIWRMDLDDGLKIEQIISGGPKPYSNGFGQSVNGVQISNSTTLLAVGMPYYGSSLLENSLQGAVAIYNNIRS